MGKLFNSKGLEAKWSDVPEIAAWDIETTGLNFEQDEINIVQIGTDIEQWYTLEIDIEMAKELKKRKLISHNGKFDSKFVANKFGIMPDMYGDTFVMLHASGYSKSLSLKASAVDILKVAEWNIDVDLKKTLNKDMIEYALLDVKYTYMLAKVLLDGMDDITFNVYTNELKAYSAYRFVELTGTYIGDIQKADAFMELDILSKELETGLKFDWIGSPKKLGSLLFDEKGLALPVINTTGKGTPSTSTEVLNDLQAIKPEPFVADLLEIRKTKKLRQFYASWEKFQTDGKIHPNFNITAATGRTTSSNPNLQQVPQDSRVRNMVNTRPGYKFVECDYSQLELRCAAFCAQEKNMLDAYYNDADLHDETWYRMSGGQSYSPDHDIAKRQRTIAKAANFGLIYGMSPKTLMTYSKNFGAQLNEQEAQEYWDAFFAAYPGLPKWHKACEDFAKRHGYIESPVGRRRFLPDIYSTNFSKQAAAARRSINSPVQGLGSDLCTSALTELTEHPGYGTDFIIHGTVHDAILFSIKEEYTEEIVHELIQPVMANPRVRKLIKDDSNLYLKADADISTCWGGE